MRLDVLSRPPQEVIVTPDERAVQQRRAYRQRCGFARKGHVIFVAENGVRTNEVHKTFLRTLPDGTKVAAINAAKRWVRTQPVGSVFVEA